MDKLQRVLENADNLSKILLLIGVIILMALFGYLIGYVVL